VLSGDISNSVKNYKSISRVPAAVTPNLRNDMYLTGDAIRLLPKQGA
jgi:inorganic phosphate transporter, PiT family